MTRRFLISSTLLLAVAAVPALARVSGPAATRRQAPAAERSSSVPRLYVASGPAAAADLARLRAAIGQLPGVATVTARPEFDAVTVRIEGDGSSTESLLTAGARAAGYVMRPVRPRFYAAAGSAEKSDISRLRTALEQLAGVDEVALSEQGGGAAVRVLGATPLAPLAAAARSAGYALQPVASYVVAGPSADTDLSRLRAALSKVPGVGRVETQGLSGGATVLIRAEVRDAPLVAAARAAGYTLWPLNNGPNTRLYRIGGVAAADQAKLRQALESLEGIGRIETGAGAAGPWLSVRGGRARPDAVLAAATAAGFTLMPLEAPVSLPTLTPEAGRAAPPDYDQRVLEEKAQLGSAAPGFTVLGIDGQNRQSLPELLAAGKPVVLIFGSCSCPRFLAACGPLQQLYESYKDRATFLLVYIAEAHPGSIMTVPSEAGGTELRVIPQIATEPDLLENLRRLVKLSRVTLPAAIDNPARSLNVDYAAYPNRIYVIEPRGTVVFKGAPGPTGFKVPDLEAWLRENVPPKQNCRICGKEFTDNAAAPSVLVNGKRIGFHCPKCPPRFAADPEKHVTDPGRCPVSGQPAKALRENRVVLNNGLYYTCCSDCPKQLAADPARWVKELKDPVTGKAFTPGPDSPRAEKSGQLYLFADAASREQFERDSEKHVLLFK